MTIVAVAGAAGSPGASALVVALGMAATRRIDQVALIEADPAGGRLGPRFDLHSEPSLASLVADARRGATWSMVLANAQSVAGVPTVCAPVDPVLCGQVLARGAADLCDSLAAPDRLAIVDLGRLDTGSPAIAFASRAEVVLLVTRPRIDEVQSMLFRRRQLVEAGCEVRLVTVGDEPHRPDEVAALVDLELAAVLPDDPVASAAFVGGRFDNKRLVRSRYWRTVVGLVDHLIGATPGTVPATDGDAPATETDREPTTETETDTETGTDPSTDDSDLVEESA